MAFTGIYICVHLRDYKQTFADAPGFGAGEIENKLQFRPWSLSLSGGNDALRRSSILTVATIFQPWQQRHRRGMDSCARACACHRNPCLTISTIPTMQDRLGDAVQLGTALPRQTLSDIARFCSVHPVLGMLVPQPVITALQRKRRLGLLSKRVRHLLALTVCPDRLNVRKPNGAGAVIVPANFAVGRAWKSAGSTAFV
ncbi:hypothetical protein [Phyllobacterium phragmitis]|uniref:hypothetical protein n=1 Tax=Phyllobacterium phragmitis TaxID=2670329 RepID=UPI0011B224AC|nr:hypothetical protein [Phyllobacterium phragmitis]